jgi:hypothetical protein
VAFRAHTKQSVSVAFRHTSAAQGKNPFEKSPRKGTASSTVRFLPDRTGVIWFYGRRGEHLRCEIRQQVEGDRFALVVTLPDGSERTELFEDSRTLNSRSLELEQLLRDKGWNGPFARDI